AGEWEPAGEDCAVLAAGSRPFAYLFTPGAADRCPPVHLGLLSTTNASLDERLLRASLGAARLLQFPSLVAAPVSEGHVDFQRLSPAVATAATRAAEVLESLPSNEARREMVLRGDRCAVIGFHAGDVLFWAQAMRLEDTAFRSALVLSAYADIFSWLAPERA